jgi:hypothetical protein
MAVAEIEKRSSGRTTRMVEHAIRLAATGRTVYVVVLNTAQRMRWENKEPKVRFETEASLGDDLDWERMRLRSAPPNCVLLVDHAVIEARFRNVFQMWQQYDEPRSKGMERLVGGLPARERVFDRWDSSADSTADTP